MSNDNPGIGGAVPEPHVSGDGPRAAAPGQLPGPQHPGASAELGTPQHAGAAPQSAAPQHAGTAPQAAAPQHAGTAPQAAAPQHAGTPLQSPQSGGEAVQHGGHPTAPGAEHVQQPHGVNHAVDHAAQHAPSSPHAAAAQHAGVTPDAAAAQHGAPHLQGAGKGGPWRQLKTLRHARPRVFMGVVGGTAAAVVTVGAVALATGGGDPPPRRAAPTTTVVTVPTASSDPAASVVVTTPVTEPPATAAPTTEAPTTTAAPTTTVPALPSGAGEYSVTFSDIAINGGGFSTTAPGNTQNWSFTGACDGVGDCSISAAGGEAVLSTGGFGTVFSGPGAVVALVPAGNGSYTSTFTFDGVECGTGTGNVTISIADGAVSGSYTATFPGSGDCPLVGISATFAGPRV